MRKMIVLALLMVVCGLLSSVVYAHNLWIIGDANNKGDGMVHLYFEHHVGPGDGSYNGPIEERGKTWLRTPGGSSKPISMKQVAVGDTKYLKGNSGSAKAPYAIDHTSLYGIYHGRLDFFHGRYIEAADPKSLAELSESSHLPVQLVPMWRNNELFVEVRYFSNPYPRAKLMFMLEDGKEKEIIADKKGVARIPVNESGLVHISTLVFEDDAAGAFEYQAFKGIMHGSTLTLKLLPGFGK